jgi:hypothetical protein
MRGRHGGQAAQAKRRGEEWVACLACGRPAHISIHQAEPYVDDWRRTALEIVVGVPVLLALLLGIPFLLWIVGSAS